MILDFPQKPIKNESQKFQPTAAKMLAISDAIFEAKLMMKAAQSHLHFAMAELAHLDELRHSNICALMVENLRQLIHESHHGFSLEEIKNFVDERFTEALKNPNDPTKPPDGCARPWAAGNSRGLFIVSRVRARLPLILLTFM